jgi:hypothetical protein
VQLGLFGGSWGEIGIQRAAGLSKLRLWQMIPKHPIRCVQRCRSPDTSHVCLRELPCRLWYHGVRYERDKHSYDEKNAK